MDHECPACPGYMRSVFISGGYPLRCEDCGFRANSADTPKPIRDKEGWDGGLLSKLVGSPEPEEVVDTATVEGGLDTGRMVFAKPNLPFQNLRFTSPAIEFPMTQHYKRLVPLPFEAEDNVKWVKRGNGKSFISKDTLKDLERSFKTLKNR